MAIPPVPLELEGFRAEIRILQEGIKFRCLLLGDVHDVGEVVSAAELPAEVQRITDAFSDWVRVVRAFGGEAPRPAPPPPPIIDGAEEIELAIEDLPLDDAIAAFTEWAKLQG